VASPFEERFAEGGTPLLMQELGNPDIRQLRAEDGHLVEYPVPGIWMPDPPQFDGTTGQKLIRTGRLTVEVDEEIPLLETDQWVISEETFVVDKSAGGIGTAQFGLVTIYLRITNILRRRSMSTEKR
jgi:hypothetical protein